MASFDEEVDLGDGSLEQADEALDARGEKPPTGMAARYLLSNLPDAVEEEDLLTYFSEFGEVEEVSIKRKPGARHIVGASIKYTLDSVTAELRTNLLDVQHRIKGKAILVQTWKMQKLSRPDVKAAKAGCKGSKPLKGNGFVNGSLKGSGFVTRSLKGKGYGDYDAYMGGPEWGDSSMSKGGYGKANGDGYWSGVYKGNAYAKGYCGPSWDAGYDYGSGFDGPYGYGDDFYGKGYGKAWKGGYGDGCGKGYDMDYGNGHGKGYDMGYGKACGGAFGVGDAKAGPYGKAAKAGGASKAGGKSKTKDKDIAARFLLLDLTEDITEEALRDYFSAVGDIEEISIRPADKLGVIKGSVKFFNPTRELRALMLNHTHAIDGHEVTCQTWKMERNARQSQAGKGRQKADGDAAEEAAMAA